MGRIQCSIYLFGTFFYPDSPKDPHALWILPETSTQRLRRLQMQPTIAMHQTLNSTDPTNRAIPPLSDLKLLIEPMPHHDLALIVGLEAAAHDDGRVAVSHFVDVDAVLAEADGVQVADHGKLILRQGERGKVWFAG